MVISGITSGSPLCGSPIILTVQANALSEGTTLAYHRVVVNVMAALEGIDEDFKKQTFHATIGNETEEGRTKTFDLSSALQTILDKYEYTHEAVTYPRIGFFIEAYEEMMVNGVPMQSDSYYYPSAEGQCLYAIGGKFSDYERRKAKNGFKKAWIFSRKPFTSPQIVCVGETFAYTPPFTSEEDDFDGYSLDDLPSGPTSNIITIEEEGLGQIGGVYVYAMPKSEVTRDRYEFRFINSLGVLESISVYSLAETAAKIESTQYSKASIETFNKFSRTFYEKYDGAETLKLSSGPIDRQWQQWFVHEFLMAKHVWLFHPDNVTSSRASGEAEGTWLPVHITAEESITLEKRTASDILAVSFTVEMEDEGWVV